MDTKDEVKVSEKDKAKALEVMALKDKFDLMYESFKDTFKGYVDNVFKTWASIIIAIGWILTSDKSRDFLAQQRAAYMWLLVAIVVITILHSGVCICYYWRSKKKYDLLINDFTKRQPTFIEEGYYKGYKITALIIGTNLLASLFLFAVLFMMIFSLR